MEPFFNAIDFSYLSIKLNNQTFFFRRIIDYWAEKDAAAEQLAKETKQNKETMEKRKQAIIDYISQAQVSTRHLL